MLAVLAPGQGAQKPGFLAPWLDLPGTEARLRWWSALAGTDLVHLGTAADAEEIRDTAKTQPLLVSAALVATEHLRPADLDQVAGHSVAVAGHSVGELAAAAIAGVFTPETAITFAAVRGREMAAACAVSECFESPNIVSTNEGPLPSTVGAAQWAVANLGSLAGRGWLGHVSGPVPLREAQRRDIQPRHDPAVGADR